MRTKTIIALCAALVLGNATSAAVAQQRSTGKQSSANVTQSRATQGWPVGYDTSGVPIFRSQLTRDCPLSLKQFSRC
jgi:hypothetical protein